MLTKVALLNSAALFLDQIVLVSVSLVLTPAIIAGVGVGGFGVWQLIIRWTGYISLMDGRPHELLKWKISRESESENDLLQRDVGASLVVWLSYLPLVLLAGLLFLEWLGSRNFGVGIEPRVILLAGLIMLGNALLIGLRTFPEAILRGSNQGYKQIGVRSLIVLLMGAASVYVVNNGYGLIGLAWVQLVGTAVLMVAFQVVTTRNVTWYGCRVPAKENVSFFYRAGFWYFTWSLVNFAFSSLDVIILGFFVSPENVTVFVVTYFAVQTITLALSTALSAVLPGMGVLLRNKETVKMLSLRNEGIIYCWWLAIAISVTALSVNQSFVGLWIDSTNYAGRWENLFIVFMALQMVFVRNDSLIINILLDQKEKVKITLAALLVVIALSVVLVPDYGILGMCASFIFGRFIVLYQYPKIISSHTGIAVKGAFTVIGLRKLLVSALLVVIGFYISSELAMQSWLELIVSSSVIFAAATMLLFLFGFTRANREQLSLRIRAVKG